MIPYSLVRLFVLALPLAIAACSSPLPEKRPGSADGGADSDAQVGPQAVAIELSASSVALVLGARATLDAWLVDGAGDVVPGPDPQWIFADAQFASINIDGELLAMRPGITALTATIGAFQKALPLSVADGDLSSCCTDAGGVTNFCAAAVGTASCPMTMPGGYCDPDGDSRYDAMTDNAFGTSHYQSVCVDGCNDLGCGCGNPAPQEVCVLVDDTNNCIDANIATNCSGGTAACQQNVTAPNCNMPVTYSVAGTGCTCDYERQFRKIQQCSNECI